MIAPCRASLVGEALSKQVYGSNPVTCPRCGAEMGVIALIEDQSIIRHILEHLRKYDPRPTGGQKIRYLPWKRTCI